MFPLINLLNFFDFEVCVGFEAIPIIVDFCV